MKKIASGDGWFDLEMSASDRETLLEALNFALKNYEHLDELETPPPEFIKDGIRVLREKTKPVEDRFRSRFDLYSYLKISETLWSMLATIRANQIDLDALEPKLDLAQLRATDDAFTKALPRDQMTRELYPRDKRKYLPDDLTEGGYAKKES